ncbi:hypothetical protein ACFW0I_22465 [[Kitasatospora] papulosa]
MIDNGGMMGIGMSVHAAEDVLGHIGHDGSAVLPRFHQGQHTPFGRRRKQ